MSEEKESKYVESKMTIHGVSGTVNDKDKRFDERNKVEVSGRFHADKEALEKAKAAAKLKYGKNKEQKDEKEEIDVDKEIEF